jgi:hypothetical protein
VAEIPLPPQKAESKHVLSSLDVKENSSLFLSLDITSYKSAFGVFLHKLNPISDN